MKRLSLVPLTLLFIAMLGLVVGCAPGVVGTYKCVKRGNFCDSLNYELDIRQEGTFHFHYHWPPFTILNGKWRVDGNEIVLTYEVPELGRTFTSKGKIKGDTIIMEDGSVLKKQ